jgi:hypothetical protein
MINIFPIVVNNRYISLVGVGEVRDLSALINVYICVKNRTIIVAVLSAGFHERSLVTNRQSHAIPRHQLCCAGGVMCEMVGMFTWYL